MWCRMRGLHSLLKKFSSANRKPHVHGDSSFASKMSMKKKVWSLCSCKWIVLYSPSCQLHSSCSGLGYVTFPSEVVSEKEERTLWKCLLFCSVFCLYTAFSTGIFAGNEVSQCGEIETVVTDIFSNVRQGYAMSIISVQPCCLSCAFKWGLPEGVNISV